MKLGTALKLTFTILAFFLDRKECKLDEHFKYYEIANQKHLKHAIKKRSPDNKIDTKATLEVKFKNKNYKLELEEENSLFAPDFKIYSVDERDVATEIKNLDFRLFHGHVSGENERSKVSAILGPDGEVGSFVVRMPGVIFAGESLRSYVKSTENADDLIVYSQADIKTSKRNNRLCKNNAIEHIHDKKDDNHESDLYSKKVKRSTSSCRSANHKACSLYVAVDYSFFTDVGGRDFIHTWKTVISIIDQVNEIFKNTEFGECGRDFGFQIGEMRIYQNYSSESSHFNNDNDKMDAYRFLFLFGRQESSPELPKHCLGHLFTAKSMLDDILGLSNIGRPKEENSGGICSKMLTRAKRNYYQPCYVNTGFTTFRDSYSSRLPSLQAMLVVAHEMGHSFGSHHDLNNNSMCVPASYPGYFLMYPFSVSGTEPNNRLFSNCSIMEIKGVLESHAATCFGAFNSSICGNYKMESREECDDGKEGSKCCTNHCKLAPGSQCSHISHECCRNCTFAPKEAKCGQDNPCLEVARCDGLRATCLPPKPVVDGESCQIVNSNLGGYCLNGICMDKCSFKNKVVCFCQGENMCKLCCKDLLPDNSTCEPYGRFLENLPTGMACALGVCDNGRCEKREVSQVQRLWPIIDIRDISSLVIFTKNNIVGLVVIVTLMVWIPASCLVGHLDRKNMEAELETLQWMANSQTSFIPQKSKIRMRNSEGTH